jgi:hypothetical protein
MRELIVALVAFVPVVASAQSAQAPASIRPGSWTYVPSATGSEAAFMDASAAAVVSVRCTRATRQVTISLRDMGATSIAVWTSSAMRTLPAIPGPAAGRITANLSASDPLLDAIAFSRGRISFSAVGVSPVVVPAWAEPARAVEDCRN